MVGFSLIMVILSFSDGKERRGRNVKGEFGERGCCEWGDGSGFLGQDVGRIKVQSMFAESEVRRGTRLQDFLYFTYET